MKTALVTGGAGFIGSNLCKSLLEKNYTVYVIDNLITSGEHNLNVFSNNPYFSFINHDITKPLPAKITNLKSIDVIYHLACPTGVPNLGPLAEEMLLTCSIGTRNILELARKYNASFLVTSSSEVYGDPEIFPQKESYTGNVSPIGIRSPYEEGKRFTESLVAMYVRKYNLNAKIVRVFNTYGPGMTLDDTRVIPKFIGQIKTQKPLTVQGKGEQNRTFCYVDDLVKGLQLVMQKGKKGEVYNLGGGTQITILDFAKKIQKIMKGNVKITFIARLPHDHKGRKPSLDKVKALGWKQEVNLDQGLKKTLSFYKL